MFSDTRLPDLRDRVYCVYLLRDPDTREVRYVGSSRQARYRKSQHLCWKRKNAERPLYEWLNSLKAVGKQPIFEVVCELTGPLAPWLFRDAERHAIKLYSFKTEGRILNSKWNIYVKRERARKWRSIPLTFNGKTQTCAAWAREIGMTRERLRQRLEKYPVEVALSTPKGKRPKVA